jgi:NOL1/NOP2/fmu family ribosome biogenesis protein
MRITGEWVPETSRSVTAKDFPRGRDVQAALKRNQLLLKYSDGSLVTAKIVNRVKPEDNDAERD